VKTIIKDDKIIVFLNDINNIKFDDENILEEYFRELFRILNKKYNIKLNGYYNVDVYKDNNYGIILEIENEDLDYYNYFNQIDMKINIIKNEIFLYEINYDYIDKEFINNSICYKYNNRLYLKIMNKINMYKIFEFSNIIYGEKAKEILKYGKKVNI